MRIEIILSTGKSLVDNNNVDFWRKEVLNPFRIYGTKIKQILLNGELFQPNADGYFMLFKESDMELYKSVFFVVKTNFYLKVFNNLIRTPDEFKAECKEIGCHNFLENYFYSKFDVEVT
jgi:hypothetical protein